MQAQEEIKRRSADGGNVIFTTHADERMEERDIIAPDVLHILRNGLVIEEPVKNKFGEWEVKIQKELRNCGREVAIVTVIVPENEQVLLVTVMWIDER